MDWICDENDSCFVFITNILNNLHICINDIPDSFLLDILRRFVLHTYQAHNS